MATAVDFAQTNQGTQKQRTAPLSPTGAPFIAPATRHQVKLQVRHWGHSRARRESESDCVQVPLARRGRSHPPLLRSAHGARRCVSTCRGWWGGEQADSNSQGNAKQVGAEMQMPMSSEPRAAGPAVLSILAAAVNEAMKRFNSGARSSALEVSIDLPGRGPPGCPPVLLFIWWGF